MKNSVIKKLSLFLTATLIFTCLIAPVNASPVIAGVPLPVLGRVLTPAMSGDNVDWIELAQYGNYSLILRTTYINVYTGAGYYNNNNWQYITYGTSSDYTSSYVFKHLKDWFCNAQSKNADNLKPDARIRKFTMENNAKYAIGTSSKKASLFDGFSNPIPIQRGFGDDIAFVLSFSEAASFASHVAFIRDLSPNWSNMVTNPYAQANYLRIYMPTPAGTDYCRAMFLRSPGDLPGTVGALAHISAYGALSGRVFQIYTQSTSAKEYGYIFPALWVNSDVFENDKYPVTVNYYVDGVAPANLLRSVSLPAAPVGSPINNVDLSAYAPAGYATPGTRSGDAVVAARDNVVNVVYSKGQYPVIVNYYKDSVSPANQIGTLSLPAAAAGTPITGVDLYAFAPAGYKAPGAQSGDTIVYIGGSTVNVVYSKALESVTVKYYKDSILESNLLGTANLPAAAAGTPITGVNATLYAPANYDVPGALSGDSVVRVGGSVVNVVYSKTQYQIIVQYYKDNFTAPNLLDVKVYSGVNGDNIADIIDLSYAAPAGYVTPGALSGDLVVNNRTSYTQVLYQPAKYPITVNYYKDSVGVPNLLGTVSLPDAAPGTAVTTVDPSKFLPSGYSEPGAISGDLTVQPRQNVINVVYSKTQYTISVQYYKDNTNISNLLGTKTYTGVLGAQIAGIIDRTLYAPAGYNVPGVMLGNDFVIDGTNVVQVVYSKSSFPVYVQYFKDSMIASNLINTDTVSGAPGMLISSLVDATKFAPAGYSVPGALFGDTVVAERSNYAYVVYSKTLHPVTVNYYRDSIAAGNLINSVSLPPAEAGTAINNVNLTQFAPAGYAIPGTRSGDTVVQAGGSVVNVLYTAAKYQISVQYYKDSMIASNLLGSDMVMSAPGVLIETVVDRSLYAPAGYGTPGALFGDTVVSERNNFSYVVYSKTVYPITVNYYKDSVSAANLVNSLQLAPAAAGTPIDNVSLTLYAPSGYSTPGVRSGDTVVAARENIVNVVYSKISQVYVYYYKDSLSGDFLGSDTLQLNLPSGLPITGINLSKFAPAGYETPGTMHGDLVTKDPFALVFVVYTKIPVYQNVTVSHMIQAYPGNVVNFNLYYEDTFQALEGSEIISQSKIMAIDKYTFYKANPISIVVTGGKNEITIQYTRDNWEN